MNRYQFRKMWLSLGVGILFIATWTSGSAEHWLIRSSIAMLFGLLFWEWMKDK